MNCCCVSLKASPTAGKGHSFRSLPSALCSLPPSPCSMFSSLSFYSPLLLFTYSSQVSGVGRSILHDSADSPGLNTRTHAPLPSCSLYIYTSVHTRTYRYTYTQNTTQGGGRTAGQIVVPNNSLSSYHRIREQRLCWPHYGSVRSYLDTVRHLPAAREPFLGPLLSLPDSPEGALGDGEGEGRERCEGVEREGGKAGAEDVTSEELEGFGLVYLDYCCRLSTGAFSLEKSPTQDIKALFRLGYFILFSLYFHIPACPIACPIAYPVGSYQVT